MIYLGLDLPEKRKRIASAVSEIVASKVVVFSPKRFRFDVEIQCPVEHVEWEQIIQYKFFYRLLQEINRSTLLVINECLRTTERSSLHYNCLRNYLTRTPHQLVFSRFPALESPDDFMILVDFDTSSRWRRSKLADVGERLAVELFQVAPVLSSIPIETDTATRAKYAKEKLRLIDGIGTQDPHTIPRRLHLLSGAHKARVATELGGLWVGRNSRLKVPGFATYEDASEPRQVLEFCHGYRDWSDYLTASGATGVECLVSDLRVDQWYFQRFLEWTEMQHNAYTAIQQHLGA